MKSFLSFASSIVLMAAVQPVFARSTFDNFISARGGQLFDGDKLFRFLSFNIPNLTYTEDDMRFDQMNSFRLPTAYEVDDALATIQQMGGRVARTYVLSVRKTNDPAGLPRHILAPDKLDEPAMAVMDEVLASANRHGVRLIIPFVDQASWWGGIQELAAFRGRQKNDFFTDPQLKEDYKHIVSMVLNRVNTKTGVPYKEDKAVLAWELGNELRAPAEWVAEMAHVIKRLAPHQLVAESYFTATDNPGVDIVQDHPYQGDPVKMIEQIQRSVQRAAGKRAYMVGEFGFVTSEGMFAVMDTIMHNPAISGGLIWSLRFHDSDGGYYWHHEPHGGDFFKAYHWPGGPAGEPYDETRFMRIVRSKAYEIQTLPVPTLEAPAAPDLFSVTDGGIANWRGSTGAATYELQRSEKPRGPWRSLAWQLTDDQAQYHPLAVDEFAQAGHTYYYRLFARNEAGVSKPSKVFGPVKTRCLTLVDELRNMSLTYRSGGKPELRSNDARNFKEDCHRLRGMAGDWIAYQITGKIVAVRVYAFGAQDEPGLEFRAGNDNSGAILTPATQDFYGGKEMYNFHWPRLYALSAIPGDGSSVTISFQKETQIGRVEIEYE